MTKRAVLIGKGRRIVIDELISLVHGSAELDLHGETAAHAVEDTGFTYDGPTSLIVPTAGCDMLSNAGSIASASILCLATAQGRLMTGEKDSAIAASALKGVVRLLQSDASLQLPLDAGGYLSCLNQSLEGSGASFPSSLVSVVGRILNLAVSSMVAGQTRSLCQVADVIAALSAERMAVDVSAYADTYYDALRPHRESSTSATIMRAILNGSQMAKLGKQGLRFSNEAGPAKAVLNAPQQIGPAREAVKAACKTLELELNCSEPNGDALYDDTVVRIAALSVAGAIASLLEGTCARQSTSSGDVDGDVRGQSLSTICSICERNFAQLKCNLEAEANVGIEFVRAETKRAEEEAKSKEAEKAAKAASDKQRGPANGDDKKDEFAGMSEEKRAKIMKKRAEKEAKAKAKAAAKEKKKVSLFGAGSLPISGALCKETSSEVSLSDSVVSDVTTVIEKLLSGGIQRKPKIAKGTRDYLPEQMMIRDQAFQIIRRVFKRHGAVEIDTPVFELKDTLTGKYGEDSKLIYDLADQGGELLALRYDLTVPFARFIALNSVGNIKRYHIGKVYRRDQPVLSKGRYREFYQCDFDIAGTYGRMVPDSEAVCVACEILGSLPIGDFGIKLNHRRLLDAILDICGVEGDKFRTICSAVDKLDKEPWEAVKAEMIEKGLKSEVADKIGKFVLQKGEPWEMYNSLMDAKSFGNHKEANEAMEDLKIMFGYLEAMGKLKYISFDLSLARGLDYYTGVIYEAICMSGNTQVGSIGGGGRYDSLVSMFQEAGKVTPCVGVSIGIERVFTLMEARIREEQGGSIKQANVKVLVASVGANMMKDRMRVTQLLWNANISAEFSQQENPKLKYELADALERGIPFMVIVGEDELKEGKCKVKDLAARTEDLVSLDELDSFLRGKGVVAVGCEFAAEEAARLTTTD